MFSNTPDILSYVIFGIFFIASIQLIWFLLSKLPDLPKIILDKIIGSRLIWLPMQINYFVIGAIVSEYQIGNWLIFSGYCAFSSMLSFMANSWLIQFGKSKEISGNDTVFYIMIIPHSLISLCCYFFPNFMFGIFN